MTQTNPGPDPADSRAFKQGLAELVPYLRAFARSLCSNATEADDLTQETLMKAWKARMSFQAGTNLKGWTFRILRNHFYSEQRRAWRKNEICDEDAGVSSPKEAAQSSAIALAEVYEALDTLPDDQREALILVGAGGFSYEEAATICDCAVGTIKSRVSRARVALTERVNTTDTRSNHTTDGHGALGKLLAEVDELAQGLPAE
ncbi:sigma-70 family RNA polymerase sigma factor [Marinicauda algicola]|uniref:Sigma-70 family RNA polymerase sigma factor n=1 Tax=Marinicauda algicola TaxID=2029849 RepID=A0A4S2H4P0_9PROT|nr:sigma-70 family RNA polymerase sigma factor [Marinicauda algicola]TGY90594.1 sigma-70 family RNA polymerase sigma factor [Marinicauda algicola]